MLIEHGTVVTLDPSDRILDPGWIRIEDGLITQISETPLEAIEGERRIDASGQVLIPGLINAHTHLFQTLIRGAYEGIPFDQWLRAIYHCGLVLTEDEAFVSAQLGAVESLRGGVTTVVEHHFLNGAEGVPDATIAGMSSGGIRPVFARTSMDLGELAPPEVLETPAEAVAHAEALLDRHQDDVAAGAVTLMVGPNTPGISASEHMIRAMGELAAERGIRQSMHIAESTETMRRVKQTTGIDGVVRWIDRIGALEGPILAVHSVHIDSDEMRLMAERDIAISHNPVSNLFLGDGIAPIPEARRLGVTVALGTDGAASNNSQDMFEVVKLASLLQRGFHQDASLIPPLDALRMATTEAAKALGMDQTIGSIEVGKRADLVIADPKAHARTVALHDIVSQLVHCTGSHIVRSVIVNGELRLDDRRIVHLDEAALLARSQEVGLRLVERLVY